jgi:succinyl-CoA synthetase beta subunit
MLNSPRLQEIEINPLMLRESGAVAVDAVIWEDRE